jgi:hypothetical protein
MNLSQLQTGVIVRGALFREDVRIITIVPMGNNVKFIGTDCRTNRTYERILTAQDIELLCCFDPAPAYDGNSRLFRLGIEAGRLALAYEYDPYLLCPLLESIHCRTSWMQFTAIF